MSRILVLDNYDSFTYNLVHYIENITGETVDVFRNNMISLDEVDEYENIVLSPGPGLPADAGIMPALLKKYLTKKKILGICLGHQAIAESVGGRLHNLEAVYHGVSHEVKVDVTQKIFTGLPSPTMAGRYHSWAVSNENFPSCLQVIATDKNGVIMGIKHRKYDVTGIQFHPESILTPEGYRMMKNWINP